MACLDMYNSSPTPQPPSPSMSPRISFSNDFVESHNSQHLHINPQSEKSPVSSDFEFSVTDNNMLSADELFFKGRILPLKDHSHVPRTLRDELLNDDDDDDCVEFSVKTPKIGSSYKWKGFLGLKRSHIGSKKPVKTEGSFDYASSIFAFHPEDPQDIESTEDPDAGNTDL